MHTTKYGGATWYVDKITIIDWLNNNTSQDKWLSKNEDIATCINDIITMIDFTMHPSVNYIQIPRMVHNGYTTYWSLSANWAHEESYEGTTLTL